MAVEKGIRGLQSEIVTASRTAQAAGSGQLQVYGTPFMIALIEYTAYSSVQPYLEKGQGTVGTVVDVKHLAASPLGSHIHCETELVDVDRRRLTFSVRVYDDSGLVGEGTHERFIIDNAKFLGKAAARREKI